MKLEIGSGHSFEVRVEHCTVDGAEDFSVLYLSDFHFNKHSQAITTKIVDKIQELDPSIVLLGGDYVDSKSGFLYLTILMKALSQRENVFAIAGNHDYFWGISAIQTIITDHNALWIEKKSVTLDVQNTRIQIDGNQPTNQPADAGFSILCLHRPINIAAYKNTYDLVLAGHLHGSQFVFWQSEQGLYPGRWFYKWNRLKMQYDGGQYLISKGLGDTLPIRYNCKKDVILVNCKTRCCL